jgi:RNA polymerase sigma factor (sigma-70 family)
MNNADLYYRRMRDKLFAFVYRITNDAHVSEDIVHEVFCSALMKDIFTTHADPSAWLFQAARYEIYHHFRKRKEDSLPEEYDILYEEDNFYAIEATMLLHSILSGLDYEIAKRCFIDGESEESIAQRFGMSVNALRVRIHRIKKKVSKYFAHIIRF